jgi:hypothetical protein
VVRGDNNIIITSFTRRCQTISIEMMIIIPLWEYISKRVVVTSTRRHKAINAGMMSLVVV